MEDRHLTLGLLRGVYQGDRSSTELARVALSHLFELCSHCRQVFEDWRSERRQEEEVRSGEAERPSEPRRLQRRRGGLVAEHPHAGSRVGSSNQPDIREGQGTALDRMREILALPEGERVEGVYRNPSRYSGPELSELLLKEARAHLPAEPKQAYGLAGLARAVLQHGNASPEATELYALALAQQANAVRAQGELPPAEELLEAARFLLTARPPEDPRIRAELDSYEGSLRLAQRRLGEAEALFSRAIETYLSAGREAQAARELIHLGIVYRQAGRLGQAIEAAARAETPLQREGNARLLLMVRHNLASYSVEAGDPEGARAILAESLSLYDQFPDPWTQLRRLWLEGRLAKAEGNVEAAEDSFRAVRDGFLEQGVGYDAALAALDLAFLYAERGRTAELKRVAEEIVPVFEAQDVHREAAAALMLFQEAVRQERATVRFLGELTRYLEQARRDPELQFRQPPE